MVTSISLIVGYPWDPRWGPNDAFWTLSCSESEVDVTIGFSHLNLVHIHTPHLWIEPFHAKWPLQGTPVTLLRVRMTFFGQCWVLRVK